MKSWKIDLIRHSNQTEISSKTLGFLYTFGQWNHDSGKWKMRWFRFIWLYVKLNKCRPASKWQLSQTLPRIRVTPIRFGVHTNFLSNIEWSFQSADCDSVENSQIAWLLIHSSEIIDWNSEVCAVINGWCMFASTMSSVEGFSYPFYSCVRV